ncbi:MAG: dihydrodipicolinate synthase family protein [Bryobacteraceae bacterium]
MPAVVTPLTEDEQFAEAPFRLLLERVYNAGSDGIYVCGQTGEGVLLPLSVRERVTEAAVESSPAGKSVIVHIGSARTTDAILLARHARKAGAHAVSSLPPAGMYSFAEYLNYYRRLADASELPLLVYLFPELAPSLTSAEQLLELCEISNVAGLKFTDFDLFKMGRIRARGNVVFNGRDEVLVAGLLMGADGGIGTFYSLLPESFVRIYSLARAGKWAKRSKSGTR